MADSLRHVEIVFILSYISFALNVLILIFSMIKLDYTYTTFFTATALSLATILYHIVVLHAHRQDMKRKSPDEHNRNKQLLYPSSTTTSLVCLYLLLGSWSLPLALIAWKIAHRSGNWDAVVQLVLIVMELVVLVAIATVCTCNTHYPRKCVTLRDDL
jgi:hypothetical protein